MNHQLSIINYQLSIILFLFVCAALTACDETTGKGQDVTQHVVAAWADAYFNYDFRRAQKYVTPESRKWLQFAATNVTQDDVDILRAQDEGATVTVSNYEETDDSTALVTLHVQGSIICDTIGRPAHPSAIRKSGGRPGGETSEGLCKESAFPPRRNRYPQS